MSWLARFTIAKLHRLGELNNRSLFFDSSGSSKSKLQVSMRLVPTEASVLGLKMVPASCVLAWFSFVHTHFFVGPNVLFLPGHEAYCIRARTNSCILT